MTTYQSNSEHSLMHHIKNNGLFTWALAGLYMLLCGLTILPSNSSYHKFFYALSIIPAVFFIFNRKNLNFFKNPIIILYLLFILFACLSTLVNQPDSTKDILTRAIYTLALFASACFCFNRSSKNSTFIALLAGYTALFICLYHFVPWLYGSSATNDVEGRFIGPGALSNPLLSSHLFGFYTVIFAFIALKTSEHKKRIILSLIAACFLAMTVATGSRTPLLAFTATLLWLPLISPNKKSLMALAGFVALSLTLYLFMPELILNRGLSYRPELWSTALEQIKASPIFGYGFGNEPSFYIESLKIGFREPHNIHLSILYFTGIAGFIFWAGMYIAALYVCIQNKSKPIFILASCLVVYGIAAGMTEGGGLLPRPKEHWFITWIPLALVAALAFRLKEQSKIGGKAGSDTI